MANKLTSLLDTLETKLGDLVTAGTLKAVLRSVVQAQFVPSPPVLGLAYSRFSRDSTVWSAEIALTLVARKGASDPDEAVIELVAAIDDKIVSAIAAGTLGGLADRPVWEPWYDEVSKGQPLMLVGALGTMRVRVTDPLKT